MKMFRWLTNKAYHDLAAYCKQLQTAIEMLETQVASLRNRINATTRLKSSNTMTADGEEEVQSLSSLPADALAFYKSTIEYQEMQKLKNLQDSKK